MTASARGLWGAGGLLAGVGIALVWSALDAETGRVAARLLGIAAIAVAVWLVCWPDLRRGVGAAFGGLRGLGGDRWVLLGLLGVVVLAIVLRVVNADEPMRYDESTTFMDYARVPVDRSLSWFSIPGNHLANTLTINWAYRAFGETETVIRLPALLAGIATVPATFWAAARMYDRRTGLLAAALVAVSVPLITYSTNARGYGIEILCCVLVVPIGLYALTRRSPAAWTLFALVSTLGFFAVPVFAYWLAPVAGWLALEAIVAGHSHRDRLIDLASLGGALLLAAGACALLYQPTFGQGGWDYPGANVTFDFLKTIFARQPTDSLPLLLRLLLLAGLVGAAIGHTRIARQKVPLWAVVALGTLAIALVSGDKFSPFTRTFVYLVPFLAIWAAAGLVWLVSLLVARAGRPAPGWAGAAVVVAAAVAIALAFVPDRMPDYGDGPLPEAKVAADEILARYEPGDGVLAGVTSRPALRYYLHRRHIDLAMSQPSPVAAWEAAQPRRPTWLFDKPGRGPGLEEGLEVLEARRGDAELVRRIGDGALYRVTP